MSRCVAITKKGDQCRNNALKCDNVCTIHLKSKVYVMKKPKVSSPKVKLLCEGKVCPATKVCNPTSGRCVSSTGKIGKELSGAVSPKVKVRLPEKKSQIFNPYSNSMVSVNSKENCSETRKSLKRINNPNINVVKKYCDVLPLRDVEYIIGPYTYDEFQYGRYNIAIFGESHLIRELPELSKKSTLLFSDFLTSLLTQNADINYDFFLEIGYMSRDIHPEAVYYMNTMVNIIENDFHKCLEIVKDCPYKNLRAHYIDYRNKYRTEVDVVQIIYSSLSLGKPNVERMMNAFLSKYRKIYEARQKVIEAALQDPKIEKQLAHNPLRDEILSFIKMQIKKNDEEFEIFVKENKGYFEKTYSEEKTTENDRDFWRDLLDSQFIYMLTPVMDLYTLARMFRSYPSGRDTENIIFYGGAVHAMLYKKFLLYIKAKHRITIFTPLKANYRSNPYIQLTPAQKAKSFLFN